MRALKILLPLLLVVLSGCKWDVWKGANIQEVALTPSLRQVIHQVVPEADTTRPAYAIGVYTGTGEVAIDRDPTDDGISIDQMGDVEFWVAHEYGHIVYRDLGMPFGNRVVNTLQAGWSFYDQEYWAMAVAEVLTGHGPTNFIIPEAGYVDVPRAQVEQIRTLMIQAGMMESYEFPIPEGGN